MAVTSWYDGVSIGNRPNTAEWQETSGLAAPMRVENAGYIWAQSDGTINKIFPINISDGSDDGAWTLVGASPSDVEDLASANVGGQPYIYLADIGNNANSANSRGSGIDLRIYRIKEPVVTGSTGNLSSGTDYETINCAYPGGDTPSHRDCETLLVDPDTGDMYFVMKRFTPTKVYRLAHQDFGAYSGTQTLEALGTITTPPFTIGHDNANGGYYTGGAISPDGTEILLKGYKDVYLFTRDPDTETIYESLQASLSPVRAYVGGGYPTTSPPMEPKGEGICYDYYGTDFYTASEYLASAGHGASNYPTYKYVRATREATETTFRQGLNSYSGAQDTFIASAAGAEQSEDNSADPTFVVDYDSASDERLGLLKFDISTIPAGSIVVGADLEVYIAVEGQFFELYEMYMDWVDTDTYSSLGRLPAFDDVDAASTPIGGWTFGNWDTITGATSIGSGAGTVGNIRLKMPASVIQNWVDGVKENKGWVFYGTTNVDGLQFASSEATTESQRPTLYVRYIPPLPDADEADSDITYPTTSYPANGATRQPQRTPYPTSSPTNVIGSAINSGRSGILPKQLGSQIVSALTGVSAVDNNVSLPGAIATKQNLDAPRRFSPAINKNSGDYGRPQTTIGWNWQTGQIKDTSYEYSIGNELVTNGGFDSDLTGWTATQTVSQSSGQASMPDGTYMYQSISVESNTDYRLEADINGEEVGLYVLDEDFVKIISAAHHGGGELLTHHSHFNSGNRTSVIVYIWSSSGGPNLIDNVSVKEVQFDIQATFGEEVPSATFLIGGKSISNKRF